MGTKISGGRAGGGGSPEGEDSKTSPSQTTLPEDDRSNSEREVEGTCEEEAEDTEIPESQGREVAERRDRLREAIEDNLEIVDEHVFGSLTRGTLVGPLDEDSDTDVMFVLDRGKHGHWASDDDGPRNALRAIKRAIKDDPRYKNTEVSIDRNVVAVKFKDYTVEIAPAFEKGDDYVIPDTYQDGHSWVRTNPRRYKQMFQASNQARGGDLEKVARLSKKYNEQTGSPVSSFHMEQMVHEYIQTRPQRSEPIDEHLDRFFERLPGKLSSGTYDPSTGKRIDKGMSRKDRRQAISDAKAARDKIRRAKRLKKSGNAEKAKELYQEVLNGDLN